jgi:hypothetical protein
VEIVAKKETREEEADKENADVHDVYESWQAKQPVKSV